MYGDFNITDHSWPVWTSATTFNEQAEYTETQIARTIKIIAGLPLIILGTIGNILSLIVLSRGNLRRQAGTVFLISLAVVDTLFLYLEIFHNWYLALTGIYLRDSTVVACKCMRFFLVVSTWSSAWLLVALTLQKLVAVCFPFKASRFNTMRTSIVIAAIILLISMGLSSHFFWTFGRTSELKNNTIVVDECVKLDKHFLHNIWPIIDGLLNSLIPAALLIIFNIIIIHKIRGQKDRFRNSISGYHTRKRDKSYTKSFKLVILMSVSFIILITPINVYFIGRGYWNTENNPHTREKLRLFYTVASLLQGVHHACNFILYCLSRQTFRKDFVALFSIGTCFLRPNSANRQAHHNLSVTDHENQQNNKRLNTKKNSFKLKIVDTHSTSDSRDKINNSSDSIFSVSSNVALIAYKRYSENNNHQ